MKKRIDASSEISLLYPQNKEKCTPASSWGETAVEDLEVERLAWALAIQNEYQDAIKCVLLELCREPDTLIYRQEILQDFLSNPSLADGLESLLVHLSKLRDYEEALVLGAVGTVLFVLGLLR